MLFEKAARHKIRFATIRGAITAEDLWDMPLLNSSAFSLDELAKHLHKQLKNSEGQSFVLKRESKDELAELKLDIVKRVIEVKLAEQAVREQAVLTKQKKDRILTIMSEKQDEALKGKTVEELESLLSEMK